VCAQRRVDPRNAYNRATRRALRRIRRFRFYRRAARVRHPFESPGSAAIGAPGIGSYNTRVDKAISELQLGLMAREMYPAVDQRTIGVSTFRNRVDVRRKPPALDVDSAGLNCYFIYRDAEYFLRTTKTTFSDKAAANRRR